MNDDLLNTPEASAALRTPVETLKDWRKRGTGPRYTRLGRRVFYRRSDLDAFIEAGVQEPHQAAS